jgi:hypothetical protein
MERSRNHSLVTVRAARHQERVSAAMQQAMGRQGYCRR